MMSQLPSWYPDADEETKPAPGPLLLVQAFVNTMHLEDGTDLLADPKVARGWFEQAGLLRHGSRLGPVELEVARSVRSGIRSLIGSAQDGPELAPLRELAETHRARLDIGDRGILRLQNPRREDLGDGLFELLLIIRHAQEEGTWGRLKICANSECRWAFYDRSRNQQ